MSEKYVPGAGKATSQIDSLKSKLAQPQIQPQMQPRPDPISAFQAAVSRWNMDDADYLQLRNAVLQLLSIDLMHYRTQQMERRLTSYLERGDFKTWSECVQALYRKPGEVQRFFDFFTINVSSFYRDADQWNQMSERILPALLQQVSPLGIQAWSVGCSIGAEPYTLSMLLHELAATRRHKIFAGDLDPTVLKRASAAGPYLRAELQEMPQKLADKYLVPYGVDQFKVRPDIREMIIFERFDILQNVVSRVHDLVICRNLMIYFTPPVKERVFRSLTQALKQGGVLFIGSTEAITNYRQYGLDYIAPSFYQRVA